MTTHPTLQKEWLRIAVAPWQPVCLTFLAMASVVVVMIWLSTPRSASTGGPPADKSMMAAEDGSGSIASGIRLQVLDGLRVVFIVNVIVFHYRMQIMLPAPLSWFGRLMHGIVRPSMSFMILSGFVRVLSTRGKSNDAVEVRSYLARNLARFCLAYYIALTISFVEDIVLFVREGRKGFMTYPRAALFVARFCDL